jgi:antitoxin ParD1/3/4
MMGGRGGYAMNVSLTPKLEQIVRQKVESGMYSNASEVVREAIRQMEARDRFKHLQAAIAEGDASFGDGEGFEFTPALVEEMIRDSDRMQREDIKPNPDVCP